MIIEYKYEKLFLSLFTLFLFIKSIIANQFITIPFYKKNPINESMNKTEIIKEIEKNTLLASLYMGTPFQKLLLNIKMDSPFSYVYTDYSYFEYNPPDDLKTFMTGQSETYKKLEPALLDSDSFYTAYFIKDTILLDSKEIKDFPIIMPSEVAFSEDIASDSGVIGIGNLIFQNKSDLRSNFIWNLKNKDIIESYDFFIEYINQTHGRIVIGGEQYEYDKIKYPNKTNCFARNPSTTIYLFWGFTIDKVTYKGKDIDGIFNKATIKLDYGYILAGHNIDTILKNDFFSFYLENGICQRFNSSATSTYHNYVCQKDKIDKTKLSILSIYCIELQMDFKIDLSKLFMDVGDSSYFLMQFRGDSSSFEFGEAFLRQYASRMTFNQDKKYIKIFNPKINQDLNNQEGGTNKLLIFIIVFCIISAIIIVILILTLIYKSKFLKKKRRGIELVSEDFDYIAMTNKQV